MTAAELRVTDLVKRFGSVVATDNLSLDVERGELHAIIGPNGAGKTTLINQLSGELAPDAGSIRLDGQDITGLAPFRVSAAGLARTFQITNVFHGFSALHNVAMAVQARSGHSFRCLKEAWTDPALTKPARAALERVGLGHRADVLAKDLSHGEQRQLEIAIALATQPRVLLLDEPMAGMGAEESARMVELIREFKQEFTVLLVEHDMDAVFALADRITVLVYGRGIATGTPDAIRANEEVKRAYLGKA